MTARPSTGHQLLSELEALLGERLSLSPYDIESHSQDEGRQPAAPPDAVAFPINNEEVAATVRACAASSTPVIPFGAGTSLEGQIQAIHGGVSVDLSRMNKILEVNVDDLDCRVQAGITRNQLNVELEKQGLHFPIDPGADASLGGMTATGASGTTAVRYGTMRENILGLTVVLADGRVIRTGGRARKSSAGYDLTRLFIGSEGTLGVITEIQLRLQPLPEAMSAAVCPFETLEGAVDTVVEVLQAGIPVARCELMDESSIRAVNAYSKVDYPVKPTVFFEFHGAPKSVEEQAQMTGDIAAEHGAGAFQWAAEREDREQLWDARHKSYYAIKALRPGAKGWPTDVAVPISRLAECIRESRKDAEEKGLLAPILGHIGDGNFHVVFMLDADDEEELKTVMGVNDRMVDRALAMGGTATGEHGIGVGKLDALRAQHGEGVDVMRSIMLALDPENLMNPGKVVDLTT